MAFRSPAQSPENRAPITQDNEPDARNHTSQGIDGEQADKDEHAERSDSRFHAESLLTELSAHKCLADILNLVLFSRTIRQLWRQKQC